LPVQLDPRFSIGKAQKTQKRLSKLIVPVDRLPETIACIAGVDVAYTQGVSIGAVVSLVFPSLSLVEVQVTRRKTQFPYIPGLLAFREIAPISAAVKKLNRRPDVFLVDGHGYAHPNRLGLASHLGLVIRQPTIGVAKKVLCGRVQPLGPDGLARIIEDDELIGYGVVKETGAKPIYVSVGHLVSLRRAVAVVKSCLRGHRLPEPLRRAHAVATAEKTRLQKKRASGLTSESLDR
jgi:deoxyribonuclease V